MPPKKPAVRQDKIKGNTSCTGRDITPLQNCKSLKMLSIGITGVKNLDVLHNFTKLEELLVGELKCFHSLSQISELL
jgi:hypothetical protein